jgi:hypothetical protein
MIRLEPISAAAMKVVPSEKLTVADFRQLGPQIDAMIDRSGRIRVVVDVTEFGGWENLKAFEIHAGFVKTHQMYEPVAKLFGTPLITTSNRGNVFRIHPTVVKAIF